MNATPATQVYNDPAVSAALQLAPSKVPQAAEVLNATALELVARLHRKFNARRVALLAARGTRQALFDVGHSPDFLGERAGSRATDWKIAPVPADLKDRRVEITGPVERKMIINALNAPVQCFMADFEDSLSPTWENIVRGQLNLRDAVNGTIEYHDPASRKHYRLNERRATLIVRPRGWHLTEKHLRIGGEPVSAALFDFGVYLANNAEALLKSGTGPYFYLPKMESHLEARLWNDVFVAAQDALGLPQGTIKATVLIETVLAAFEMDEILFELRDHIVGLNCGRWDYIFSYIKKFRNHSGRVLPERGQVTMDRPFLKSYVDLLIQTCHRRGAHAMGGMAAQIPIRGDAAANAAALDKVRADKLREGHAGHDGTWVAHPALAAVARGAFDIVFRGPNQLEVLRPEVAVTAADLLAVPEGTITEQGIRHNIRVGIQYLEAWLTGNGCVPLYNLMEDAATAEICRSQLWQWVRHEARTDHRRTVSTAWVDLLVAEELDALRRAVGPERFAEGAFATAARLFGNLATNEEFDEFLTLSAYDLLP